MYTKEDLEKDLQNIKEKILLEQQRDKEVGQKEPSEKMDKNKQAGTLFVIPENGKHFVYSQSGELIGGVFSTIVSDNTNEVSNVTIEAPCNLVGNKEEMMQIINELGQAKKNISELKKLHELDIMQIEKAFTRIKERMKELEQLLSR